MSRTLADRLIQRAVRLRLLARTLFGIDFEPLGPNDYYFDVTTVVLFRRARRVLDRNARVLDMGTGSMAVLGLALWKRLGCTVLASDVNPDLVSLARRNVQRNRAPIRVVRSRYFDAVPETVDMVLFNPPYVATRVGARRRLAEARRSQWDGGPTGLEVIQGYFAALSEYPWPITSLLGVNTRHIPVRHFAAALTAYPRLTLSETYHHPLLPVTLYTLTNTPATADNA